MWVPDSALDADTPRRNPSLPDLAISLLLSLLRLATLTLRTRPMADVQVAELVRLQLSVQKI